MKTSVLLAMTLGDLITGKLCKFCIFALLVGYISVPSHLFSTTIPIYLDYCLFQKNEKENILEIYYGLLDNKLKYYSKDKKWFVELNVELKFFVSDTLWDTYDWIIYHQREFLDTSKETQNLLVGQKNFLVSKDSKIKVQFICTDIQDKTNKFQKVLDVENMDFSSRDASISDIQLAQFIELSDTSQMLWQKEFLKSKFYVVPNPTLEVIGTAPRLYVYFEYYLRPSFMNKQIKIEYRILNTIEDEVLYNVKTSKVVASSQFAINGFALDALSSGTYFLEITLVDENGNVLTRSKKKKFYLFNAELPPEPIRKFTESELFERSIFVSLDEQSLDLEFEKAKYIASDYEKSLYKELKTVEAKRRFLFQFWQKRNPDTSLVYNKAYDDFVQRINYANRFFSVGNQIPGWKTDRGRVLIQYGEPTSREYHPPELNKRSYEVWFYSELQGGAYFYFVDLYKTGNFVLVHSNAMNEPYNENWYTDFVTGTNTERLQKMMLNR